MLDAGGKTTHHHIKDRGQEQAKQRHAEHASKHRNAHGVAHFRPCAAGQHQRNHASNKGQGGHQDRP